MDSDDISLKSTLAIQMFLHNESIPESETCDASQLLCPVSKQNTHGGHCDLENLKVPLDAGRCSRIRFGLRAESKMTERYHQKIALLSVDFPCQNRSVDAKTMDTDDERVRLQPNG